MAYSNEEDLQRLQKILAQAGIASRRKAEDLIREGRVIVNGKVVTELGTKANPDLDHIKVDGRLLKKEVAEHIYIALHKPDNVVSTSSDPQGRTTVLSLLEGLKTRVFPVGRLDYHSTGLILLTNDGDLSNAITAAKSHITKTYMVKTKGSLTLEEEDQFRRGVPLHGIRTAPAGLRLVREGDNPWYEVRLIEGRNQQIRIMFKHFGHLVEKLRRISIGDLQLGTLKPGEFRFLDPFEVKALQRLAKGPKAPKATDALKPAAPTRRPGSVKRPLSPKKQGPASKRTTAPKRAAGPKRTTGPKRER